MVDEYQLTQCRSTDSSCVGVFIHDFWIGDAVSHLFVFLAFSVDLIHFQYWLISIKIRGHDLYSKPSQILNGQ